MFGINSISVGDKVHVAPLSGTETVVGTVTWVHQDVKNGRPGIDYTLDLGGDYPDRWAYLSQITKVVKVAVAA